MVIRSRRPASLILVALGLALTVASTSPAQGTGTVPYTSPVKPVMLARLASLPVHNWLPGHRGVDLSTSLGDPVYAPAAGRVTYVGFVVNRPVVTVRHAGGLVSSIEPVDAVVAVGDIVAVGDAVGTVSAVAGHCAPAVCVHWGLRRDGHYVNPLDYLRGFGPITLLALEE